MNAEKWHEDTSKDEPPPPLVSLWARAIENTEAAARLQPPESESRADQYPQPVPDEEPDSQETRASLLRAIESTELAARLQPPDLSPPYDVAATAAHLQQPESKSYAGQRPPPAPGVEPDNREILNILLRALENREPAGSPQETTPPIAQPDLSMPSEPTESGATLPISMFPAAEREEPVNRQLPASPTQVAASSAAQQHRPLPEQPLILTPPSQTKSAAAEKPPDSTPPGPSARVRGQSAGAAFIAKLKNELRWVAPKNAPSTRAVLDGAEKRLSTLLQRWLALSPPQDLRRNQRLVKPPLVAYYWTGSTPRPQTVADISASGLYVATDDRWLLGTGISMALQRTDQQRGTPEYWIPVNVMVIRQGDDGFGGVFIPSLPGISGAAARKTGNCVDKETIERFVKQLTSPAEL